MTDNRLFLLDGHALVYRAHYAFIARPLINSKGWNTSAIAGFVRTLWDLIKSQRPTHIAVSFDPPGPTFRHKEYEAYKANREAQPEDITFALPYIRDIIRAFRIPVVMVEGYEADDVIGTLSKQAEAAGYKVYMVTPDKDYAQLVSPNIFIYKPSRQGNGIEILGPTEVTADWGIQSVSQVIDVLGLQGDSVDNIPGIPGVGPKTAVQLLEQYGTVEGVIAHVDELKGKVQERVREFAEQALQSKWLATIDTQAPVQFDERDFELEPFDKKRLTEIFKELEFRTLAEQILNESDGVVAKAQPKQGTLFDESPSPAPVPASSRPAEHSVAEHNIHDTVHTYHLADTPALRTDLVRLLSAQPAICFDTESTDIDPSLAELVGMSFAVRPHEAWYVPVPADRKTALAIVDEFKPVLENTAIAKIGQNIKYDAILLKWYGVEVSGEYYDTMMMHYLLEPELRHNMDYMAETYLKYQPVSIETLIGKKGKSQLSMRDVPVEQVVDYAAEDADVTLQLKNYFEPRLHKDGLDRLYWDIESPLISTLVDLEYAGVNIDVPFLAKYATELEREIAAMEIQIYELAGLKFNIASPKQVGDVLFQIKKIPYRWSKTKTGQYSTDEDIMAELALEFPVVQAILRHRGLAKLKSTYVDALPRMVNPKTGRVHSSFNQALAATGRLSSNNPNLQNIPIRTPEGAKVRRAFVPRDADHVLLSADYSQIELRLIAEIAHDEAMLEAFAAGQDIHRATAARVYGVPFDQVTADQRRNAKTVNFSIIYGAGALNLSRQLNIKRAEATELISQYFKQYTGLKNYMERTVRDARESGYVTTLMGRRRYLRDINSRNGMDRSNAERIAINTPIQGTAADMIKIAMVNIHRELRRAQLRTAMILQVHDELVFDVQRDELETMKQLVEEKMRTAIPNLKVPIVVEMGVGNNWLEAH
jgi:DNA polymerase-1